MSEITIDIDDYISDDEKRSIAREAFRAACQSKAASDFERILSNSAYELVSREVDAAFDGNMVEQVRKNAVKVIHSLGAYTVFGKPNAWDREASKGWTALQDALSDNQPLIVQRVRDVIDALDQDELREMISDRIADAVFDRLRAREVQP